MLIIWTGLRMPRTACIFIFTLLVFLLTQMVIDQIFIDKSAEIASLTLPSTVIKKAKSHRYLDKQIFVRSSFRVSDSEIRLTILKDYRNRYPIFYEYGSVFGQLTLQCNLPKCLDNYSPKCKVVGFIGQIFNLTAKMNHSHLRLRLYKSKNIKTVNVIDVRPHNTSIYSHQLGVCVQPIYMHADFVVFIQFFEHWLARNATKFYIYRHSYSKEIQIILDFYAKYSNASIEFIDWSDLPSQIDTYEPNKYVYRLEVMMSIFDCLHRSRFNVKYVAQTDLDELVIVRDSSNNLIDLMDSLSTDYPEMSSASFVSRRAKLPPNFKNISSPSELNFGLLSEIGVESYWFPRPVYSKLIHRPERVFRGHIHVETGAELIDPNGLTTYKLVNVPKSSAYILHLRRIIGNIYEAHHFRTSDLLAELSAKWQISYQQRLQSYLKFQLDEWENLGLDVLMKIENCRLEHHKRKQKECNSVFDCTKDINTTDWFWAKNSWVLLY